MARGLLLNMNIVLLVFFREHSFSHLFVHLNAVLTTAWSISQHRGYCCKHVNEHGGYRVLKSSSGKDGNFGEGV